MQKAFSLVELSIVLYYIDIKIDDGVPSAWGVWG